MKVCTKPDCEHKGQPQPLSNFRNRKNSRDGKDSWCKDCRKQIDAAYRKTEDRKVSLYNYTKTDKFKAAKKRYQQSDKGKAAHKRYNQSDKGKANFARQSKRKNKKYNSDPEYRNKILARNYISYQVKAGNIPHVSTKKCLHCGKPAEEYHHHLGYNKKHWGDVQPLCIQCHRDVTPE